MKLNKFLTFLTPVAIVGTITPTIASCSCSKKTYVYNYKDHINCLNKQYGDYRKLGTIQKAAKIRTERQPAGKVVLSVINAKFSGEESGGQFAFNEFIASATIMAKEKINLNGWNWTDNEDNGFVFGDDERSNVRFYYDNNQSDNKIYLHVGDIFTGKSYVYQDCWTE